MYVVDCGVPAATKPRRRLALSSIPEHKVVIKVIYVVDGKVQRQQRRLARCWRSVPVVVSKEKSWRKAEG